MVREIMKKLNSNQRTSIEVYREEQYFNRDNYIARERSRSEARAYTKALIDSGILTKREASELFIYTTCHMTD